ncbi:MAG: hypothetical protein Ta2B_26460 [Termitinemataceae bacterium]|nr:MAG: hypothetical protein Ta2B_26460 [Termitinemataceae bacterium]
MPKFYTLLLTFFTITFSIFSCGSSAPQKTDVGASSPPKDVYTNVRTNGAPPIQRKNSAGYASQTFDPSVITPEQFRATKTEIVNFVYQLNTIIRTQNYEKWVSFLDPSYFKTISTPEFLEARSNMEILRSKNIILESPRDYFFNVVVPSRSQDKVDDIAFVSETRIKAFTVLKGQRLRLYDLEKRDNKWFILN